MVVAALVVVLVLVTVVVAGDDVVVEDAATELLVSEGPETQYASPRIRLSQFASRLGFQAISSAMVIPSVSCRKTHVSLAPMTAHSKQSSVAPDGVGPGGGSVVGVAVAFVGTVIFQPTMG